MKSATAFALLAVVTMAHAQAPCVPPKQVSILALPSGTMIEGVGSSDLPITSSNDKAKALIRQGYALIHCFWFNEAVRTFRDATKEDPACGAAWLGLNAALTLPWHSPSQYKAEAEYAIKRAVEVCGDESDVEQGLIAAFRLRSASKDDRESEFEKAMDKLIESHPDEAEPRLLISAIRVQLCLNDGYDKVGNLREEMKKVMAWITPILKKDPKNGPALHYHIHAVESFKPMEALQSARQLGLSTPGSSHMVHMPGHIFNRVGMYEEAQKSFRDSQHVDDLYIKKMPGATTSANWNYGHNMEYMTANLIEMGRIKEAKATGEGHDDILWRTSQWSDLAPNGPYFSGMAAVRSGDLETAEKEVAKMEKALANGEAKPTHSWGISQRRISETKAAELRGLILVAQAKTKQGLDKLRVAVKTYRTISYDEPPIYLRLPHESLGEALIAAKLYDEAILVYKDGLFYRPNSGWLLFGIAKAHEGAGRKSDALAAHKAFLAAWKTADADRPEIVHAKAFK
ncbi:MAG: hypothetical protein ACAH95_08245 [Fimbriimonas sp.]